MQHRSSSSRLLRIALPALVTMAGAAGAAAQPLPEGTAPAEGASAFVNPLTALGMVETMRREGHKALVHTAAAGALVERLKGVAEGPGGSIFKMVPQRADPYIGGRSPNFRSEFAQIASRRESWKTRGDRRPGGTIGSTGSGRPRSPPR